MKRWLSINRCPEHSDFWSIPMLRTENHYLKGRLALLTERVRNQRMELRRLNKIIRYYEMGFRRAVAFIAEKEAGK